MNTRKFTSKGPEETKALGTHLAKYLKRGNILCLFGELGSGKTTLIKGLAEGLNIDENKVNSPTFVLLNVHQGRLPLFHFDLYRLEDIQGIGSIGYEEFLYDDGISVIEWADRLGTFLPDEYLKIELMHKDLDERVITLSAKGQPYQSIVEKMIAITR
jgi:tRNA threonylcarbamoyladenosine biosynthesis protein TsaE